MCIHRPRTQGHMHNCRGISSIERNVMENRPISKSNVSKLFPSAIRLKWLFAISISETLYVKCHVCYEYTSDTCLSTIFIIRQMPNVTISDLNDKYEIERPRLYTFGSESSLAESSRLGSFPNRGVRIRWCWRTTMHHEQGIVVIIGVFRNLRNISS